MIWLRARSRRPLEQPQNPAQIRKFRIANRYNWFNFEDYGMDLYSNGMMVPRELLEENPEAVAGLVRAGNKATMEVAANQDSSVEAFMAYDNLIDADLERARLEFALTNLMNAPEVATIGMGNLVDERLTRSIKIVAKGYGLDRLPDASEIFDRSVLPPVEERAFEAMIN